MKTWPVARVSAVWSAVFATVQLQVRENDVAAVFATTTSKSKQKVAWLTAAGPPLAFTGETSPVPEVASGS